MNDKAQELLDEVRRVKDPRQQVTLLYDKSLAFLRSDPLSGLELANEAVSIATSLADMQLVAMAVYRRACFLRELVRLDEAEQDLSKALTIFTKANDEKNLPRVLQLLGGVWTDKGDFIQAKGYYEQALELYQKSLNEEGAINASIGLGNLLQMIGEYAEALKYYYRALKILPETDPLRSSIVLSNIGATYIRVRDFARAEDFLVACLRLKQSIGDQPGIALTFLNLAKVSEQQGNLLDAHTKLEEALDLARYSNQKNIAVLASLSLGELEVRRQDGTAALSHLELAERYCVELGTNAQLCECLLLKGRAFYSLHRFDEAAKTCQSGLGLISHKGLIALEAELHLLMAESLRELQEFAGSSKHYALHVELHETVLSEEKVRAIAEVQARIEIEKAEQGRVLEYERAEKLRVESERRARELTSLALQIVEKNEFLSSLLEELQAGAKEDQKLREYVARINDHIRSGKDWGTFETQFNEVHQGFLKSLSERFPDLTPTELKISAMMKLNLPSKAIANLFCLSTRTVENHRLSIRRKLGLSAEDNLVSYLTSF